MQNYIIEKVTLHSLHVAIVFTPSASKINNFQFSPRFKRSFKFTYMPHRSFRICLVSRFSQRKRYRRTADEAVLFQVWPKVKPVLSRIPPCKHSTHTSPSSAMRSKKKSLGELKIETEREFCLSFSFLLNFFILSHAPCKFFQLWHDGTGLDLGNLAVARVSVDRSFDRFLNELYRLILSILYFRYF